MIRRNKRLVADSITDVNDLSDSRIASYGYDAFGRRSKKTLYDENGSVALVTYFVYDIMGNVITEYEQTTGVISWAKDYIYGGQGELVSLHLPRTSAMNAAFDNLVTFAGAWLCYPSCTTQQLTWDTNSDDQINLYDYVYYVDNTDYFDGAFSSNIYYCLTDKNNSVVGLVDADGDVEYITYNAWGVPSYTDDIQGLSVLWNGYYHDAETENYYLRNRYYSTQERKFLTEDPHGIAPDGNWNNPFAIMNQYTDGVSLSVYAGANPVMNRDDWGLKCCCGGKSKPRQTWFSKGACGWFNEKLKCCGGEKIGNWYCPDNSCCENNNVAPKVPIWVCRRKLVDPGSNIPKIGPLSHTFIACQDPASYSGGGGFPAFGKQPEPYRYGNGGNILPPGSRFRGPGYIETEPFTDFSDCRVKMVCPADKKRMCQRGPTQDPYFLPGILPIPGVGSNCHDWGNCRTN